MLNLINIILNKILQIKNSILNPFGLYNCYNIFYNYIALLIFYIYNKSLLAKANLLKAKVFNYNFLKELLLALFVKLGFIIIL